jgi:hypothetical protein
MNSLVQLEVSYHADEIAPLLFVLNQLKPILTLMSYLF